MSVSIGISAIQAQSAANVPTTANAAPLDSQPTASPPPPTAPVNNTPPTSGVSGETPVAQVTSPVVYTAVANVNAPTILGTNVNFSA